MMDGDQSSDETLFPGQKFEDIAMWNWIRSVPVTAIATSLLLVPSMHTKADDQRPAYSTQEQADYRQPVDIALDPTGQAVAVACEKTGSILVLDRSTKKIIQTLHVASSLNDLHRSPTICFGD